MKLTDKETDYIKEHLNHSVEALSLSKNRPEGIDYHLCLSCIKGNQKIRKKVLEWGKNPALVYPYPLSLEQCSSQATAEYKCKIIESFLYPDTNSSPAGAANGNRPLIVDITGGMGVDSFYMSRISEALLYIERDALLCEAAENNFQCLGADNITIKNITSSTNSLLEAIPEFASGHNRKKADIVFADPARRDKNCGKVIRLEDYEPNILELKEKLRGICNYLLVKVSPMADIKKYLADLGNVACVYIVSVDGECKELLFMVDFGSETDLGSVPIKAVNLNSKDGNIEESCITFCYDQEQAAKARYTSDLNFEYLYEPNKSVLKAACYKLVSQLCKIDKIAPSTHLYTGNCLVDGFPGKCFKVVENFEFGKKQFKAIKGKYPAASVTARNIPVDSNQLKKMLGVKENETVHIFAYSMSDGKRYISVTHLQ